MFFPVPEVPKELLVSELLCRRQEIKMCFCILLYSSKWFPRNPYFLNYSVFKHGGVMAAEVLRDSDRERLAQAIESAGFSFAPKSEKGSYLIEQVGYQNRSVNVQISLEAYQDVRLIKFEALVVRHPATFEKCLVGVFFGNSKSKVSSFHPREVLSEEGAGYQIVARTYLYADHYSYEELKSMLQIFVREVDEIDDELLDIVENS